MNTNPLLPYDFIALADATLMQTCEEYRDLLAAITPNSSLIAGGLKLQVEEALCVIEAELAARSPGFHVSYRHGAPPAA